MPRPFIILALPRTGTSMLVHALRTHPDIGALRHEFIGDELDFLKDPQVLSNYYQPWMRKYPRIHVYRENSKAGALSMLMMHYIFPDGVQELPIDELLSLAKQREDWDAELRKEADWSVSYEDICGDAEITELPAWFSDKFCGHVGLAPAILTTDTQKSVRSKLKNEAEVAWLLA